MQGAAHLFDLRNMAAVQTVRPDPRPFNISGLAFGLQVRQLDHRPLPVPPPLPPTVSRRTPLRNCRGWTACNAPRVAIRPFSVCWKDLVIPTGSPFTDRARSCILGWTTAASRALTSTCMPAGSSAAASWPDPTPSAAARGNPGATGTERRRNRCM